MFKYLIFKCTSPYISLYIEYYNKGYLKKMKKSCSKSTRAYPLGFSDSTGKI